MLNQIKIRVNPNVKDIVNIGYLQFSNLNCQKSNSELWEEIKLLSKKLNEQYKSPTDALEKLRPARDLYRAIGIEPTKHRPSSEALFRRVIQGKDIYQINSIVDVCNYCSLAFFLPIGLYDLDKTDGALELRKGMKGEEYQGIGKSIVHVENRLTIADAKGTFGNPSADSQRTSIAMDSNNVMMVLFAPSYYSSQKLEPHLHFAEKVMIYYHPHGKLIHKSIESND